MKTLPAESDVTEFFDSLRESDKAYAAYSERYGALSRFVTEYEHLKGKLDLTQKELAQRSGTTQSAISRFESMRHPPSYDFLVKISQALGDELFISPAGSQSLSLPYDLRERMAKAAERRGISVKTLVLELLRRSLAQEELVWANTENRTLKPIRAAWPSRIKVGRMENGREPTAKKADIAMEYAG